MKIPEPYHHLGAGSGTHAQQTARIMTGLEELMIAERPDMVMVVGDVNSTVAAALVAKKLNLPLAHVEAGLRSGDRSMPEEINRLVTDSISDILFASEPAAYNNLLIEGHKEDTVHMVGQVMIDTLLKQYELVKGRRPYTLQPYGCITLHRPSNVDDPVRLKAIMQELAKVPVTMVYAVHPRTRAALQGIKVARHIKLVEPMSYTDWLAAWSKAAYVVTDSGGLQEETTALGIPCITLRDTTERPITTILGSNVLAGLGDLVGLCNKAISGAWRTSTVPPKWDGHAAERIAEIIDTCL